MLNSHMWPKATVLDNTDYKNFQEVLLNGADLEDDTAGYKRHFGIEKCSMAKYLIMLYYIMLCDVNYITSHCIYTLHI